MVIRSSDPQLRVWVTSPNKPSRPTEVLVKTKGNRGWRHWVSVTASGQAAIVQAVGHSTNLPFVSFPPRKDTHQILKELLPKLIGLNWSVLLKCGCSTAQMGSTQDWNCQPSPRITLSWREWPHPRSHPVWSQPAPNAWMMWGYKGPMPSP